jgi:hypothetical protein
MTSPKILLLRAWTRLNSFFGKGLVISVGSIMLICVTIALAAFLFLNTAAPRVLTITAGPTGSSFQRTAERYQKILERDGVTLKILPSDGSAENLSASSIRSRVSTSASSLAARRATRPTTR